MRADIEILKRTTTAFLLCIAVNVPVFSQEYYTQIGTDPTWDSIIKNKQIPIGHNSTDGITGSRIDVNNDLMDKLTYGSHGIPQDIKIHSPGSSQIPRSEFPKWTRWYQEDGNTQVYRIHKGEYNVRNEREGAARIESFYGSSFKKGDGWQTWEGSYTIVDVRGCVGPHYCGIFQVKDGGCCWSVMLKLKSSGELIADHLKSASKTLAKDVRGKSFDIKIRDDGLNSEVYFNGELAYKSSYSTRDGSSTFRWGMYFGRSTPAETSLIFVTGATINGKKESPNSVRPSNRALTSPYVLNHTPLGLSLSAEKYPLDISIKNLQGRELWRFNKVTSPQIIPRQYIQKGAFFAMVQSKGGNTEFLPLPLEIK